MAVNPNSPEYNALQQQIGVKNLAFSGWVASAVGLTLAAGLAISSGGFVGLLIAGTCAAGVVSSFKQSLRSRSELNELKAVRDNVSPAMPPRNRSGEGIAPKRKVVEYNNEVRGNNGQSWEEYTRARQAGASKERV